MILLDGEKNPPKDLTFSLRADEKYGESKWIQL